MKMVQLTNGQVLLIREAVREDATRIIQYLEKIPYDTEFLTFGPGELTVSVDEEEKIIEESLKARNKVTLVAEVENEIVGCLNFRGGPRPRNEHAGEFGVSVLKDYWGQGIGKAMIEEMIEWAKVSKVVRKINLLVRSDNRRAIHIYERLGFMPEGVISRGVFMSGQFYDYIHMGYLIM